MIDTQVTLSKSKVVADICWALVAALIVAAWVTEIVFSHSHAAMLLGLTACALSAYAAVRHMRCYMVRIANLIRFANNLDGEHVEQHIGKLHGLPGKGSQSSVL